MPATGGHFPFKRLAKSDLNALAVKGIYANKSSNGHIIQEFSLILSHKCRNFVKKHQWFCEMHRFLRLIVLKVFVERTLLIQCCKEIKICWKSREYENCQIWYKYCQAFPINNACLKHALLVNNAREQKWQIFEKQHN